MREERRQSIGPAPSQFPHRRRNARFGCADHASHESGDLLVGDEHIIDAHAVEAGRRNVDGLQVIDQLIIAAS